MFSNSEDSYINSLGMIPVVVSERIGICLNEYAWVILNQYRHKKRRPLLYSPQRHANAYQTYTNRERPSLGANSSRRFDSLVFGVSLGETYLKFTLSHC